MRRFPVVLIAVSLLLALSIPAFGQTGPGGGGGGQQPPPCAQGQLPNPQNPCMLPPCAQGQQPSPQSPCIPAGGPGGPGGPGGQPGGFGPGQTPGNLKPCAEGQQPSPQSPCIPAGGFGPGGPGGGPGGPGGGGGCGGGPGGPGGGGPGGGGPGGGGGQGGGGQQESRDTPGGGGGQGGGGQGGGGQGGGGQCQGQGGPSLKPGFLSRVWRFNAEVDSYDAAGNVLNCTITKITNLPKKFASQDDDIVDSDAFVLFDANTRVYDADGKRIPKEQKYDTMLDNAEHVKIVGKVLRPDKWHKDADDNPTPTLRAKRVYLVD